MTDRFAPPSGRRARASWQGRLADILAPRSGGGALVFGLTALVLGLSLLLGGASREHALRLAVIELPSLLLIAVALWRLQRGGGLAELKWALLPMAGLLLLPILQLLPLPFEVWSRLPGRAGVAEGLRIAGAAPEFLPMTLTPAATREAALALLIPTAVFLGASACSPEQRRLLTGLVVLAAGLSILLGLAQMAGGPNSPFRLFETTNRDSAVGLFANRNHQAVFLLICLPLCALWIDARSAIENRRLLAALTALAVFGVALVGVAITKSRAGLLLTLPALLGALAILWRQERVRGLQAGLAGTVAVAAVALLGAGLFALDAVLRRFSPTFGEDYRIEVWPYVTKAAQAFSPVGSGLGSFDEVYRAYEPVSLMTPAFVNHAHNEYLQVWMEAGWAGLALLALGGLWVLARSATAWRAVGLRAQQGQAASVALAVLLLHSAVDYPVRTPAVMAVAALMLALLAAVRLGRRPAREGGA